MIIKIYTNNDISNSFNSWLLVSECEEASAVKKMRWYTNELEAQLVTKQDLTK